MEADTTGQPGRLEADKRPEAPSGDAPAVRLITLAEAATATGLTAEALRKRILRGKLRGVRGNNGEWRVLLSAADAAGIRPRLEADRAGHSSKLEAAKAQLEVDSTRAVKVLEGAVATLREAGARDAAELARLRDELTAARERLARQEAIAEGLQPLVARLEADRDSITAELASVYQEAQEARQLADQRAVELAAGRERAATGEGRAAAEAERASRAEAEAQNLRAELERLKARGWLARLLNL